MWIAGSDLRSMLRSPIGIHKISERSDGCAMCEGSSPVDWEGESGYLPSPVTELTLYRSDKNDLSDLQASRGADELAIFEIKKQSLHKREREREKERERW